MTDKPLKIVFMGTPDFAASALKALLASPHDIVCVYSQPPRPAGRGQQEKKSAVHQLAEDNGIQVRTPLKLKGNEDELNFMASLDADVAVVAAYGLILPQTVLDIPRYGCLNIHASLLPKWRGASPIQHAIWEGDDKTGVAIMQMEAGLDTGPVIKMQSTEINTSTTASTLHDTLAEMGGTLILDVLDQLATTGQIISTPQDNSLTSYARMLTKQDGIIDWSRTATQIDRQIRALTPWPGCFFELDGKRFKLVSTEPSELQSPHEPGTIIDKDGHISCGQGTSLKLTTIQPDGKKAMSFSDALNGNYISLGS